MGKWLAWGGYGVVMAAVAWYCVDMWPEITRAERVTLPFVGAAFALLCAMFTAKVAK